jgi:hypothetical protein
MTTSGPGLLDLSTEIRFEILRHCLVVDRSIGFRDFVWLVHVLGKIRLPLLVCKQLRAEGLAVFWGCNTILLNRFSDYDDYPRYSPNLGHPRFLLPRSRIRPQIFHLKLYYNLNFMHGTTADRMRGFQYPLFPGQDYYISLYELDKKDFGYLKSVTLELDIRPPRVTMGLFGCLLTNTPPAMDEAFGPILEVLKQTRLKAKKFTIKFKDNGIEENVARGEFTSPLCYSPDVPESCARLEKWKRRMEEAVTLYS